MGMADQAIQSVWDGSWWKKIECVKWAKTGNIYSWGRHADVQDNLKTCHDLEHCDVITCISGDGGLCYGKNLAKVGKSSRDCGVIAYVREHTPWWSGLGSNTSGARQEELHNSSHLSV